MTTVRTLAHFKEHKIPQGTAATFDNGMKAILCDHKWTLTVSESQQVIAWGQDSIHTLSLFVQQWTGEEANAQTAFDNMCNQLTDQLLGEDS